MSDEVRNRVLALGMAWGPTGGLTRAQRVAAETGLDEAAAQALLDDVLPARNLGVNYVYSRSPVAGAKAVFQPKSDVAAAVRAEYPWVDDANLDKIYNDACYETWHG
jgi:hypothetical protein